MIKFVSSGKAFSGGIVNAVFPFEKTLNIAILSKDLLYFSLKYDAWQGKSSTVSSYPVKLYFLEGSVKITVEPKKVISDRC